MRFITAHTQLSAVKRELKPLLQDLVSLHLSINYLWLKGPHSFPEMTVLSAENFVIRLFLVQPRTVVVQDDFETRFKKDF